MRLIASPGQRNDIAFAHELIDGLQPSCAIADKGYDANHLIDKIVEMQATVVIPPKRNRKDQRSDDAELYKERNIIEHFFNKLKQFNRHFRCRLIAVAILAMRAVYKPEMSRLWFGSPGCHIDHLRTLIWFCARFWGPPVSKRKSAKILPPGPAHGPKFPLHTFP
jgi:transposase